MLVFENIGELHASGLQWRAVLCMVRLFHYLPPNSSDADILLHCYKAYYGREPDDSEEIWLMVWKAKNYHLLPFYVERWLLKGAKRPFAPAVTGPRSSAAA